MLLIAIGIVAVRGYRGRKAYNTYVSERRLAPLKIRSPLD
jgi:hypothetical protein